MKKKLKDLDYTYIDTWIRRENKLQDLNYRDYLKSNWWKKIKSKCNKRKSIYSKCQFCDTINNIDLHHTSYKWIRTNRELSVIIPLCRQHHLETHKYAKKMNISIRLATNQLRKKYKPNWNKECKQKTNLKN